MIHPTELAEKATVEPPVFTADDFGAAVQAVILTGEGSSQVQDLLLLGRSSFVNGFGDCR